jgi:hypothetical protein
MSMATATKMRRRVQRRFNHQKRGMLFFITQWTIHSGFLQPPCSLKGMSVDDFLGAGFMEEEDQDVSLDGHRCENPNITYDLG